MADFNHCCVQKSGALVKIEENKRKAVFKNDTGVTYSVYRIDGCVIEDTERADYLVKCTATHSIIIEFKGAHVQKAVDQIESTLKHKNVRGLLSGKIGCLVVCSKVRIPKADFFALKTKQRFANEYRAGFRIVCDKGVFDPDELVLQPRE